MSLFRREREVRTREDLEAYLDKEKGQVKARLYARVEEDELHPVTGAVTRMWEYEEKTPGLAIRCSSEGEDIVGFLPFGRGIGEAEQERWSFTLGADEQLSLEAMRLVVLSRHELQLDSTTS